MAITKETVIDKIEIVGDYNTFKLESDSNQRRWCRISRSFHRLL